MAKTVETMLHKVFKLEDAASKIEQVPLWKVDGAGICQGIGPYVIAVRAMPLPLPAGWKINKEVAFRADVPKKQQRKKPKLMSKTKKPLIKKVDFRQPKMESFFQLQPTSKK